MKFTKMHGCGNDYVYINGFSTEVNNPNDLAIKMSDRHFGIGSDGIVLILPSKIADFKMRMFNSDGSEAEMCGNAIRCVGKYVYDKGLTDKNIITVETLAGIKVLNMQVINNKVEMITVDMGEPILEADNIPVISDENPVLNLNLKAKDREFKFTCVSMGNPHAITYVDNTKDFDVHGFGAIFEVHKVFPKKINVEFVELINKNEVNMRVWERGAGETWACGTGACATHVANVLNGHTNRKATIHLLGGDLQIEWKKEDNHIYMTGPATFVFDGEWPEIG